MKEIRHGDHRLKTKVIVIEDSEQDRQRMYQDGELCKQTSIL